MAQPKTVETCITGYGVSCGGEVHVNADCSIEISAGTVVMPDGRLISFPKLIFPYYRLFERTSPPLTEALTAMFGYAVQEDLEGKVFELTDAAFNPDVMDSLKQQHPDDMPEFDFLMNKILALLAWEDPASQATRLIFCIIPLDEIAKFKGIQSAGKVKSGLFKKKPLRSAVDLATIEQFLNPAILLQKPALQRFGYQKLAIINKAEGLEEDNLRNPFSAVTSYSDIFFEYKEILDQHLEDFRETLNTLHEQFGHLLTHKGLSYLEKFRNVLAAKWLRFCEEGEHLYYIQYFYTWLADMHRAYEELLQKLDGFSRKCLCAEREGFGEGTPKGLVFFGPVLRGRSGYKSPVFRDEMRKVQTQEDLREVRFLHWRLMMMIWTFDLPFLRLDKVLYRFGFDPGIEEAFDSTNYWEWADRDGNGLNDLEDLPIKFTPTQMPAAALGRQAIPYYYPVDRNSLYSIHQYWDYFATRTNRTDRLLSYNAHPGDPDKPSTDVINDSYTDHKTALMPLVYSIAGFPVMRVEGFMGKTIVATEIDGKPGGFHFAGFDLAACLQKYNLSADVIAINVSKTGALQNLRGLDTLEVLGSCQTLVLLFNSTGEQIELEECKKDDDPEILPNTIVAAFVWPCKISCCHLTDQPYYSLTYLPV